MWTPTLFTALQIKLRDYLLKKFPIIKVTSSYGTKSKTISLDFNTMSYVSEYYRDGVLRQLKSARNNFETQYDIKFDNTGKRISTFHNKGNRMQLNHHSVVINLTSNGMNLFIDIQEKQPININEVNNDENYGY